MDLVSPRAVGNLFFANRAVGNLEVVEEAVSCRKGEEDGRCNTPCFYLVVFCANNPLNTSSS
jgi:hypothetical protein